ncbi:cyclodeaminase/cyclohydrolase family protein [Nocardiopsis salina]|uniref:cyclodeaminase/cyclohydrolase family protein n=1 Tax=Nocardiopsis salina TaxID=245836 RepID=UPI0003461B2C|nr:cyclodeaminase/cyclohydrolase family protein [Nocardiopsis salina]
MRSDTVDTYLNELAARVPAPGGGAAGALHAAQGAALVGMVARYSNGSTRPEEATTVERVRESADTLRERALVLAEQDVSAFRGVSRAYRMPRSTPEEKGARSRAIAGSLSEAGRVPAEVVEVAARVADLAEHLRPLCNPNLVSDIAAAAEAARAAAATSRVNVEINLCSGAEIPNRDELAGAVAATDDVLRRADETTEAVREQILR